MDNPGTARGKRGRLLEEAPTYEVADQSSTAIVPRPLWKRMLSRILRYTWVHIYTVVPFVILAAAFGYYYYQYNQLAQNNSDAEAKAQIEASVADIERLMYVSDTSGAQLATITDITKLKGQKFFEHAQNGDHLLLFPAAKKAVLYRPSTEKIIEVGPFTPEEAAAPQGRTGASENRTTGATSTR